MTVILDDYYEAQQKGSRKYGHARIEFEIGEVTDALTGECKAVENIKIHFPGQLPRVLAAEEWHKTEYAAEYQAFKLNQEPATDGFPLEHWALLSKPVVNELKRLGFRTVEQLATATEDAKRKLNIHAKYIKDAQTFLDSKNSTQTEVTKLRKTLDQLTKKIASLEDQNNLLIQRIQSSTGGELASVST
jgi:polyhydroxyalkanoate synthesis regulator phasin